LFFISEIILGPISAKDGKSRFSGQAPAIFCESVFCFLARSITLDFLSLLSSLSKQLIGPLECSPG
jgi:hypothetical protein